MFLPSQIKDFNLYFLENISNYMVSTKVLKAGIYNNTVETLVMKVC